MSEVYNFTTDDMVKELDREVALRQRVYPRWVESGKMKPLEARRRIALLQAVRERLRKDLEGERLI